MPGARKLRQHFIAPRILPRIIPRNIPLIAAGGRVALNYSLSFL
jgi:hypothetical protein